MLSTEVAANVPAAAIAAVPTPIQAAVDFRDDVEDASDVSDALREANWAANPPPSGPKIAPNLIAEFAYSW